MYVWPCVVYACVIVCMCNCVLCVLCVHVWLVNVCLCARMWQARAWSFYEASSTCKTRLTVRHCWESRVISSPIHLPLFLPAVDEPRRSCGTVHVQRDHARSASVYRTSQHTTVRTDKLIWLNNVVLIHHSGFLLLSFDTISCLHSYALHDSWNGGIYRKVGVRIKTKDLVILVS